jgi:mannose-1-phosphate guanylyltransferase
MHADWDLPDLDAFAESGRRAFAATAAGDLVTCGIVPTRAETGYGYIIPGDPLPGGARRVARFTEKPDQGLAERLISEGALWNSGLFCWRATRLREEVERHAPEIAKSLSHLDRADVDRFFAEVTPVAIDNGVLERSPNVAVVDGRFPWDDVGTWAALSRTRKQDALGNVSQGSVHQVGSSNCVAWAESAHVVLAGVKDLVVVEANGRILVMPSGKAAQLKEVLDQLPPDVRDLK